MSGTEGFYGTDYDDDGNPVPGLLDGVRNGEWLYKQEFPPLRYHVPGIVPEGLTVLAGAPKAGKSWLVLSWLLARASGGLALGAISVTAGDVLYIALEDGDRRMQYRCRVLLGNAWRPDDPIPARFEYLITLNPGELIATIAEWLMLHPTGLVVVDTLGKVLPPAVQGGTSFMRDYRIMGSLKAAADAFPGAALLMNHHDRKAVTADFVDSVSGTNGIAGAADTVLVLTRPREDSAGLLQVTGRDVTEVAYAVTFERGIWSLDGHDLDAAAAAARQRRATIGLDDRAADITGYVGRQAEPVAPAQVAAALHLDNDLTGKYLRRLADAGRIHKNGRGLYTAVRPNVRTGLQLRTFGRFGHTYRGRVSKRQAKRPKRRKPVAAMTTTRRRMMRARSTRPLHCGHVPRIGDRILHVDGSGWCCLPCTLRLARDAIAAKGQKTTRPAQGQAGSHTRRS